MKPDIERGACRLGFWRMDTRASIARHIFGLHSACCWGIWFTKVRLVVNLFSDQFGEAHISAQRQDQ